MRRFYSPPENFLTDRILIGEDETRHLRDVLRLRIGDEISVFDGAGREYWCVIEKIERRATTVRIIKSDSSIVSIESPLKLTLAVALLKGEKFDLVVQKACEIGVSTIVPLQTKRADVRIRDEKDFAKKVERWQKIALEAAKQCGRATLMKIVQPISLRELAANAANTPKIFFSERGGESFDDFFKKNQELSILTAVIGPEGGWEDFEIEEAREMEFHIITLGGRILRAETAAITVSALLQHHFGDLN